MPALTPLQPITAHGRGVLLPARLEEHLKATVKRLKKLGLRQGDTVASLLPHGPDAMTVMLALEAFSSAKLFTLDTSLPPERYMPLLLEINPRLLLMYRGEHAAAEAARSLAIPVANVLRHYEAGVFTLEQSMTLMREQEPLIPAWKSRGTPLVLMAPGLAYRSLAKRLDSMNPVISITPPSLEFLPPPHTIEHVAVECVRILRRYRSHGPYALAGWRLEGLIALEMARLLEHEGESVAFVALMSASDLFARPIRRFLFPIRRLLGGKSKPICDSIVEALRRYHPSPWHGRILHIRPAHERESGEQACFAWRDIAPQGISTFDAPAEMLVEPQVETLAGILALELGRLTNCDNRGSEPRTRHA